jgi:hypothetical protein
MIASDGVVDPARVLVERLVVVQREHLSLLVARILLLLLLSDLLKGCLLLLTVTVLATGASILLLFILFIEECKVIRILTFTLTGIGIVCLVVLAMHCVLLGCIVIYFHELLLLLAVGWRALLVAD